MVLDASASAIWKSTNTHSLNSSDQTLPSNEVHGVDGGDGGGQSSSSEPSNLHGLAGGGGGGLGLVLGGGGLGGRQSSPFGLSSLHGGGGLGGGEHSSLLPAWPHGRASPVARCTGFPPSVHLHRGRGFESTEGGPQVVSTAGHACAHGLGTGGEG